MISIKRTIGILGFLTGALYLSVSLAEEPTTQPSSLPTAKAPNAVPSNGPGASAPVLKEKEARPALDPILIAKAPTLDNPLVHQAERVEIVAVKSIRQPETNGVLGHEIVGEKKLLTSEQVMALKEILHNKESHVLGARARCRFRPTHGLIFGGGKEELALLVNAGRCPKWGYKHGKRIKAIDLRKPAAAGLRSLIATVFEETPQGQTPQ
jgi:hypothetical protein